MLNKIINCRSLTFLKVVLVFTAVSISLPAQTGQNIVGSPHSEITSFAALKASAGGPRRVAADVCLTEAGLADSLEVLGFHHIVLGANLAARHMLAGARYGADTYELVLDRCTGQVQQVKSGDEMA